MIHRKVDVELHALGHGWCGPTPGGPQNPTEMSSDLAFFVCLSTRCAERMSDSMCLDCRPCCGASATGNTASVLSALRRTRNRNMSNMHAPMLARAVRNSAAVTAPDAAHAVQCAPQRSDQERRGLTGQPMRMQTLCTHVVSTTVSIDRDANRLLATMCYRWVCLSTLSYHLH